MDIKKCSLLEHKDIESKVSCLECNIYMCNKCETYHSKLFPNHKVINSDKDKNDIFTGFCKEKGHPIKLEFFCKTHNQLCCAICIAKIKKEEIGKHKDCDIYTIEEIKEEKNKLLEENVKYLKDMSNTIEKYLAELKSIIEKINENKEEIKLKIINAFTKIRNELNKKEDELLLEVEQKFENAYYNEKILKENEKLPDRIKALLETAENINNYNNENKLSSFINICVKIENNISIIKEIKCNIEKSRDLPYKENIFIPEEKINKLINGIKRFCKFSEEDIENSLIIEENEIDLIKNFIGKKPKFKLL